jgi:glycine/D-amino acid oxidase-like deaminating enzyme
MASRRRFLKTLGAAPALIGLTAKAQRPIAGQFVHDSFPGGHRIRDRARFSPARRAETFPIVIVGAGMAGLCAAWRLLKRGFRDFVLLEMEAQPGGNARWGENEITPYPWAAHYVPVPGPRAALVRELFEDLGVLENGVWNERYLCFSPQERLFLHGRWQEGVLPETGATARDREQYRRFRGLVAELRATGQFTIPIEERISALDRQSFAAWLDANRFDSPYLRWYLDYACRDDYGALARDTSAWAGVHYFAAREQEPEAEGPLTWPEGNGWIARRLAGRAQAHLRPDSPVYAIVRQGRRWLVRTEAVDYAAERVIFAAPTFLAPYIVEGAPPAQGFVYSPWLTANLTLDRLPAEKDSERAWDNVIYDSPALGYVVATHMSLRTFEDRSVWTYYYALAGHAPAQARALLLEKDWGHWREFILDDLARAHPDIRRCVSRIDVMRLGHAMIRPAPGFLSSPVRRRFADGGGGVDYAHSDLSGVSILEEAQYRGVRAADRALRAVSR